MEEGARNDMTWLVRLAETLVVVAVLNFLAAAFVFSSIGADPMSGRVEKGHCLYSNHGRIIEVGALLFHVIQWQARSLYVTQPLGGLAMVWLWLRDRRPS